MELENIILSEVSKAQRAKNHMFSLICILQTPNKCSNIIEHGSHTKRRAHTGDGEKRKENYNLHVVNVLSIEEQIK
jgi:hypothetical protein